MTNERLKQLLIKCMDWIEADNCDTLDTLQHLGFNAKEIKELGFGYLIHSDNIMVVEAVKRALEKYDASNVDVVLDEESNTLNVIYHSKHNSFDIESYVADAKNIDFDELEILLEEFDVGYVW